MITVIEEYETRCLKPSLDLLCAAKRSVPCRAKSLAASRTPSPLNLVSSPLRKVRLSSLAGN